MNAESGTRRAPDQRNAQLGWTSSVLTNFCEIPLETGPYVSVELQTVAHEGQTGGVVLLRRRQDRELEIHVEPHLGLDNLWTTWEPALRHQICHSVNQTSFDNFVCEVGRDHVLARCQLDTLSGRPISVDVAESGRRKRGNVFTPAPPGTLSRNPRFLVMGVFGLLSRSASISVRYGAEEIEPAHFRVGPVTLPILEARFGGDLVLATLRAIASNEHSSGRLERHGQFLQVDTLSGSSGTFEVGSSAGVCATGTISRQPDSIRISDLDQDWNPGPGRPVLQLLRMVRRARRSPSTVQLEVNCEQR